MTDQDVLQRYVDLVPFLGTVCGEGCEIVVHDTSKPDHSLIAISNGVSGREIGNPITDLAMDLVRRETYMQEDYISNYCGQNKNGEFLCSTYFIKNEGRLIGMLCVNKDVTAVQRINTSLRFLLDQFNLKPAQESEFTENLDNPVADMMHSRIADTIAEYGVDPTHMSIQEKINIVHRLDEDGVLMMKGAKAEIAKQLMVSVPTVYRYLKKNSHDDDGMA